MASLRQVAREDAAAERRDAILAAAARCLADIGYDRVRLRDISRESGVSIGLIQHYFETRDVLLREAFDFVSGQLIANAERAALDGGPWERLEALVDSLLSVPDLDRQSVVWIQHCVVASREPALRPGVARIFETWRERVEEAVKAGVADGSFRPRLEVETVIDVIVTQVDGCELAVAAGYRAGDRGRLRTQILGTAAALLDYESAAPA